MVGEEEVVGNGGVDRHPLLVARQGERGGQEPGAVGAGGAGEGEEEGGGGEHPEGEAFHGT